MGNRAFTGTAPLTTNDIESLEVDVWDQTFDLNVRGAVFLIREAVPHLKASRHAAVLNILSTAGFGRAQHTPPTPRPRRRCSRTPVLRPQARRSTASG